MRLFVAIVFSEQTRNWIYSLQKEVRSISDSGTFPPRENLHMTLAFLGDVHPARLSVLRKAIDTAAASEGKFPLILSGLGTFQSQRDTTVWLGSMKNERLAALQKRLQSALEKSGFPLENRAFRPHITLGRRVKLRGELEILPGNRERASAVVERICLMRSEFVKGGMIYTEIYGKDLRHERNSGRRG